MRSNRSIYGRVVTFNFCFRINQSPFMDGCQYQFLHSNQLQSNNDGCHLQFLHSNQLQSIDGRLSLSVSAFESTRVRWRTGMDWCQFRFVPGFSSVTRASAVVFGQMWNTPARAHRLVTALWLTADVIALHDRRHSFILHASFFLVRLHSSTSALNHAVYILFTFTTFKKIRAIRSAEQEPWAEYRQ